VKLRRIVRGTAENESVPRLVAALGDLPVLIGQPLDQGLEGRDGGSTLVRR
jgi:hypothetical protein